MDSPERTSDPQGSPEPERPRRRRRRWGRGLLLILFFGGATVGGAAAALVKSGTGQRLVLDTLLSRIRRTLAGELVVDAIRSPSLLGGATLVGVHLDAAQGRPFLTADSIRVRYALLSLVGHVPRVASLTVWGPHVDITRLPGESEPNVARLLRPDTSAADSLGSPLKVSLASVRIVDGTVQVLTPVEGDVGEGVRTVASPDGNGRLRRLGLDSLSLELRDVVLTPSDAEKVDGQLASMAMQVSLFERPIRIAGLQGRLTAGSAGLRVENAEIRTAHSTLEGAVVVGPRSSEAGVWGFNVEATTRGAARLSDLDWLDARIPDGTFSGGIGVTVASATNVELRKVHVGLEASDLNLDGRVAVDDQGMQLRGLQVEASPLAVHRLEPWIGRKLPLGGWLSGHATLAGRLDSLAARGRVTLVPTGHTGRPTTAEFDGIFHAGAQDPGVTKLEATLDPLNFDVLDAVVPGLVIPGVGRATVDADGRAAAGIRFTVGVSHMGDSVPDTRATLKGSLRRGPERVWAIDVQSDFSPLALTLAEDMAPTLDLRGTASGSVHAVGALDALHVTGDLSVGRGTVKLDGTINARAPAEGYRLDATLDDVPASSVVGRLPEPSRLSGHVVLDGRGLSADSVTARGSLVAYGSRLGGLHVDSVTAQLSAAGGHLRVDTLDALVGGMKVRGSGELGLVRGSTGQARLTFHTDSLLGMRSVFLGDSVMTRDGLSALELTFLRMEGVNPDTLPTQAEVAMSGSLDGRVTLAGSLPALDVEGTVGMRNGVFGPDTLGQGDVRFQARSVLSDDRQVHASVDVRKVTVLGRSYDRVLFDGDLKGRSGTGSADVVRSAAERYTATGGFTLATGMGGSVVLDTMTVQLDSLTWRNTRTVRVGWDSAGVTVRDLDIARPGNDPMHVSAQGRLAWRGTSDFQVDARGLHVERVTRVAQREDLGLGGHLDLGLRLTGPARDPLIDGSFQVEEPRISDLALSRVSGELHYRDEVAAVRLDADDHGQRVFDAVGTVPVNLALGHVTSRVAATPMDVRVRADSMDAAVALSYVKTLQEVSGTVSGNVHIGGTLDEPEPSGELHLSGGAWTIEALGVRHTGVQGNLTLEPDRTVQVDVSGRTREGNSSVTGTVTLSPARDPGLDLKVAFHDFEAVNRRDVNGDISGAVTVTGSYRLPLIKGDLTVDHGNLFTEEAERSADVVDLTDPRIFDVVDTTSLEGRPLLAEIRNPFMDNLRVEVNLSVPRDSWLRSEDMNVEMGGDLLVRYDRSKRDVVMVGELQALRGSYSVLGRRFDVQQGTVGFIGTPGINPTLDIQAVAHIRRINGDAPLDVTATVGGTLAQPKVNLTSDEQGVAESDLVSYLIFGRPSYELASSQQNFAQGAGRSVLGAAASAGVTYLSGTLATRLGSALSRQVGLDYLSITQAGDFGVATGTLAGSLTNTQVEVGQYWGDNVFFVLVFRPRPDPQQSVFAGARTEVALGQNYNFQGFWEDRFLRSGVTGFGDLAGQASKVIGVFIFRDWGY